MQFIDGPGATHIPPADDCGRVEVLGKPSVVVLSSGIVASHGGLLVMVLPRGEYKYINKNSRDEQMTR